MTTQEIRRIYSADNKGMAHCPAHDDKKRSLHISAGRNGDTVMKCHAGCETGDVLAAKGLTLADLFSEPNTTVVVALVSPEYVYSVSALLAPDVSFAISTTSQSVPGLVAFSTPTTRSVVVLPASLAG
jgi:hypothetical protein